MGAIIKQQKRATNLILGRGYKTNTERRHEKAAKRQQALDQVFASAQMPDEEEVRRTERRKAARRKGSRAETILTDQLG